MRNFYGNNFMVGISALHYNARNNKMKFLSQVHVEVNFFIYIYVIKFIVG